MKTFLKITHLNLFFLLFINISYFSQNCSNFDNNDYFDAATEIIGDGSNTLQFGISNPNICTAEWLFTGGGLSTPISLNGLAVSYTFPSSATYQLQLILTECNTGCSDTTNYLVYAGSCNGFTVDFTPTMTGDSVFCDVVVQGVTSGMLYGGSIISVDNTTTGQGAPAHLIYNGQWDLDGWFRGNFDSTYTTCITYSTAGLGNQCVATKCKDILIPSTSENSCTDYVTVNTPEGIYLIGDTTFTFDNTNQIVSMEIYGLFNNWDLSSNHQADQTYFTVNGGTPVSLEDIYNNQPYALNGVSITIDTTSFSFNYLGGSWTTGTILFSGNISSITMTQFESGLLKICSESQICSGCQINADFTYTSNSHNYYFVSAGTGSEYEWSFGDGESSSLENPFHNYATPGTYNVCLTNYNLVDTCSITICDTIEVTCTTPNATIITPNQDGIDDFINLQCNDVKIYDRNGALVVSLLNQTIWDATNSNGALVPMGEYIIVCQSTGVTTSVSVIW